VDNNQKQLSVSVIVPCYNEQHTIQHLLAAIEQQDYPLNEIEVIIADGLSTDLTRQEISTYIARKTHLKIMILDNPKRSIPAALNLALDHANGEYIIRLDAHSAPADDYIRLCVERLKAGLGDNVGGIWNVKPGGEGWISKAIAIAGAHPMGVGDARYRYGGMAEEVDTVPFGSFRKGLFQKIGQFNENLLTNEDYEFNTRIRKSGGRVWLDPAIKSDYFARRTLADLTRQYFRYGFWKWNMLKNYPTTIRWRQALPPLFVVSIIGLASLSIWYSWARILFIIELLLYSLVLIVGSIPYASKDRKVRLIVGIPLAICTMHCSWGAGFLWSGLRSIFSRKGIPS
jgi:glycosyltransferase involved in cell wall biosynthesis